MWSPAVLLALLAAPAQASAPASAWGPELLGDALGRDGLDTFHVLGFANSGLFAYLVEGCGDEAGYSCSDATVIDLATDRVIDSAHWDDEGADHDDAAEAQSRARFSANVRALLRKHGIDREGRVVRGDKLEAEQRFQVTLTSSIRTVSAPPMPDDFLRTTTVSLRRDLASKRIGVVARHGMVEPEAPTAFAIVVSPYDRRVAVLLLENVYGGCIGGRPLVSVIGADLDARYP
jgi:hypothetical protein